MRNDYNGLQSITQVKMQHYFCEGNCKGVSNEPGNCQAESCELHNHPLTTCECDQPEHEVEEKDSL